MVTCQHMQKTYTNQAVPNPLDVLRKAGYSYFKDPQSGQESFVIRLSADFYPRFHLYVKHNANAVTFDLHLDQKKASYGDNNLHSGEYDGPVVDKELRRIDSWVQSSIKQLAQGVNTSTLDDDRKQQKHQGQALKKWWQKLWR